MSVPLFGMDGVALAAIVAMSAATYATRADGFWLMSHVTLSRKLERFLRYSAGGVLIAIVVQAAMKGDVATWAGLAVTVVAMIALRRSMLSICLGTAVAIAIRALG